MTYSNFNWIYDVKDGVPASKNWKCLDFQLHAVERLYTEKNRHSEVVHDVHRGLPHDLVVFAPAVLRIPH